MGDWVQPVDHSPVEDVNVDASPPSHQRSPGNDDDQTHLICPE